MNGSFNEWLLIHSFTHLWSQPDTWLQCQYSGHHGALQSHAFLLWDLYVAGNVNWWHMGGTRCVSIDDFSYLLWFELRCCLFVCLIIVQSPVAPVAKTTGSSSTTMISWLSPHSYFSLHSQRVMRCRQSLGTASCWHRQTWGSPSATHTLLSPVPPPTKALITRVQKAHKAEGQLISPYLLNTSPY